MLSLPPFYFANEVDNLTGTPSAATPGTNFSTGATNADGSAVGVLGALAFDAHFLVIGLGGLSTSTVDTAALADLLVDPAGGTSWASLIDDLTCGFTGLPAGGVTGLDTMYAFPLYVKAGSTLGVRARSPGVAITTGRCCIWAYGNPSRPGMWWCGQKVETLGSVPSTSKGTSVTPGNTGAAGSWTSIGSVTTGRYGSIQLGLNGSDNTMLAVGYHWQIGYGSNKLPGSPTLYHSANIAEATVKVGFGQPIWCDIAQGTQMQVMGTCSGTAEAYTACLYGVM